MLVRQTVDVAAVDFSDVAVVAEGHEVRRVEPKHLDGSPRLDLAYACSHAPHGRGRKRSRRALDFDLGGDIPDEVSQGLAGSAPRAIFRHASRSPACPSETFHRGPRPEPGAICRQPSCSRRHNEEFRCQLHPTSRRKHSRKQNRTPMIALRFASEAFAAIRTLCEPLARRQPHDLLWPASNSSAQPGWTRRNRRSSATACPYEPLPMHPLLGGAGSRGLLPSRRVVDAEPILLRAPAVHCYPYCAATSSGKSGPPPRPGRRGFRRGDLPH